MDIYRLRVATQTRVQTYPERPRNPLHDSSEFYVQCAIKFVHEHEHFRRKRLKGNGRGRITEGKERGLSGYLDSSLEKNELLVTRFKSKTPASSNMQQFSINGRQKFVVGLFLEATQMDLITYWLDLATADAWNAEKRLLDYLFADYSPEVRPRLNSSEAVVVSLELELRQLKNLVGNLHLIRAFHFSGLIHHSIPRIS